VIPTLAFGVFASGPFPDSMISLANVSFKGALGFFKKTSIPIHDFRRLY